MTAPRVLYEGVKNVAQFYFNGTLAVPMYCLLYHDTDDVKPAASQADGGTEFLNQQTFARLFAGVALAYRTTSETSADAYFPVATDIELEIDCASGMFEVGDLVAIDEASGGTSLENQKVVKVTDENIAIGYATKRYGSATTRVQVRLISKVVRHDLKKTGQMFPFGTSVQTIDMNDATVTLTMDGLTGTKLTNNILFVDPNGNDENLLLPPEAQCAGLVLLISNTGGEHVVAKDDANGYTVATIEDNETGFVVCDGTTWYGFTG